MIYVFDRFEADEYYPLNSKPTIAIRCMSSPNGLKIQRLKDYEPLRGKYVSTLDLVFDDVNPDEEDIEDYIGFNRNMAQGIAKFIEGNNKKFEDIMVHCDAGLSRSCAVGAALGDSYGFEYDREIWHRKGVGDFNLFVYNTLMSVLSERKSS